MTDPHTPYIFIIIFFTGFSAFALIQYVYIYVRTARKGTLISLLFSLAAFLYIGSDALVFYFSATSYERGITIYFTCLRELIPLSFLPLAPVFLNQELSLKPVIKKINRVLFLTGFLLIAVAIITVFISPEPLITGQDENAQFYSYHIHEQSDSPLLILLNIALIIYLLYTIAVILYYKIRRISFKPVTNSLVGLTIMSYFIMRYLYFLIFIKNQTVAGNTAYHHIATGIVILLIFINFGTVDLFTRYYNQLSIVKNDLNRILYIDSLLEIPNRMGFIKDLQSKLNEIETDGGIFSLIFLDIDDFQNLNECFGENVGNELLKKLSKRLLEYFTYVALYRTGGDEFVLVIKEPDSLEDIKTIAAKIIASLRNSFSISGISYTLTASLGILQIPHHGKDTETILNNAYSVIRSAKKNKNTFEIFTQELTNVSTVKIHIVNLLRKSIERDQFALYYQPIVNKNKKLIHAETLLRCTNPDPSIGGPGTFIPIIEEAGLINDVDNMVIRKAFHDMEMRIKKKFSISINLSVNQLINPAYGDFLSSFADQHGIENRHITLEITENKLMENMSSGRENLMNLKDKGFRIAIDDFGKGFSSLTYLVELPVDILKMDIEFVHSVPGDKRKESIVRHIIEMAHSLDLKIVAEGFETKEQFEFFKSLGCDLYQGYYFSKPLPIDELLAKFPA